MSIRNVDAAKPAFDGHGLRKRLRQYSREPFLDVLAEWMECAPDQETIKEFANSKPDRWATAIRQLQQMSGFVDRKETDHNINIQLTQMTDIELNARLKNLAEKLGLAQAGPVVETLDYVSVDSSREESGQS